MSTLELKELSHPSGEVIKIAAGKTLDLKSQGSVTLPVGTVTQFVRATGSTVTNTTSSTFANTNASVTITPLSASSHIYLSHTAGGLANDCGDAGLRITRAISGGATTTIYTSVRYGYISGTGQWTPMNWGVIDVDEAHNTTSAITYTIQINVGGSGEARHCDNASWNFVAMEMQQ
jgi:hypothetical protein